MISRKMGGTHWNWGACGEKGGGLGTKGTGAKRRMGALIADPARGPSVVSAGCEEELDEEGRAGGPRGPGGADKAASRGAPCPLEEAEAEATDPRGRTAPPLPEEADILHARRTD